MIQLGIGKELYTALYIGELNFHASFDYNERVLTAMWKWAMDNMPVQLCGKVMEYKISDEIRVEYK